MYKTREQPCIRNKENLFIYLFIYLFIQRMNSPNLQQRAIEWRMLDSLLKSYELLYNEEQAFLMEV